MEDVDRQHRPGEAPRTPEEGGEVRQRGIQADRGHHTHEARGEGTFFVWFRLPDGMTCERLLEERRVAVAPGEGFGEQGRGWARLSLATADEKLDLGLERLCGL